MTYIKPQVLIHQQFSQPTNSDDTTLRAMIVGPNAVLHRYSDPDEKALIELGDFKPGEEQEFPLTDMGISVGGVVDKDSATLYIDGALETYFSDDKQTDRVLGANEVPAYTWTGKDPNTIICNITDFNFVNFDEGKRYYKIPKDVEPGDYVWIRCKVDDAEHPCGEVSEIYKISRVGTQWSESEVGAATAEGAQEDTVASNVPATVVTHTTVSEQGPTLELTKDGTVSGFNPYLAGKFQPTYTITADSFITSANCSKTLRVKITSNVEDTYYENVVSGVEFRIGSYGYKGTLTFTESNITFADADANPAVEADSWVINEKFKYTAGSITSGGEYLGDIEDTYYVEITRGGEVEDSLDCPVATIYSSNGYDYVANIRIKDHELRNYGINGVSVSFDADAYYTGQKFKFSVSASEVTAANCLVLQNNLKAEMLDTDVALDIKLLTKENIALKESNTTFTISDDNIIKVEKTIIIRDALLADDGFAVDAEIEGGKMYFEFREWVQSSVGELNYCDSVSSLDLIPGQLDPANPVKYAVYKALTNSNGVPVAYTAVSDPTDMDAWADAFGIVEGAEDVYSITPTSQDIRVLNQAAALIEAESGAEQCRWKSGVFSIAGVTERMLVGRNVINNNLFTTSTDMKDVKATFEPQYKDSAESPYDLDDVLKTYVTITSGNASFEDIKPGDTLRVISGTDSSERYTINKVISNDTVEITTNPYATEQKNKRIEVWHKLTKNEQAEYFGTLAGSFNTRRIVVVAPDIVGEDNIELPGYYVAAAISGLKSGINAYQGMTRIELTGFDDFSRTKPYFTESQLNIMAEKGVSIVVTDSNGTAYIRHALTTDTSTTSNQEEVITRDYDYVCKNIHSILNQYIGRYSSTEKVFDAIYTSLTRLLQSYVARGYITSYSDLTVQSHALLADRVEVYVTIGLPYPINNIEVYVTAQKG